MNDTNEPKRDTDQEEKKSSRRIGRKPVFVAIGIAALFVLAAILFTEGFLVAATVNGSPVSRLAVIRELERQSGKEALESMIDRKLIEAELDRRNVTVTEDEIDGEIRKIEGQISGGQGGGTLDEALAAQDMTRETLREQIAIQKRIEKLLAEKAVPTDAEIDAYMKNSGVTPPEGIPTEEFRRQIGEDLKQQKLQGEAQLWISGLKESAQIRYYVGY